MIGSNHFNHSQERLHCDYVTNILQKEMILGIPDQVIFYNLSSMFPQSYRCHDLKEDLMGTKFLLYLSNMLSTIGA